MMMTKFDGIMGLFLPTLFPYSTVYIAAMNFKIDEYAILFLNIKKDSAKSISAFYAVFLPLQRTYKVVFQSCFPLLPYMALAFLRLPVFYICLGIPILLSCSSSIAALYTATYSSNVTGLSNIRSSMSVSYMSACMPDSFIPFLK